MAVVQRADGYDRRMSDQWRVMVEGVEDPGQIDGVETTHDDGRLNAYATDRDAADAARAKIEEVTGRTAVLQEWDGVGDRWRQVDPPLEGHEAAVDTWTRDLETAARTETFECRTGRFSRGDLEATMRDSAERLGLTLDVGAKPALLSVRMAFTVSGPAAKVADFDEDLRARKSGVFSYVPGL